VDRNALKKTLERFNHLFGMMNVGVEVYGKGRNFERPVLILKKFDDNFFFGIPITSRIKQGDWYAPIHFSGKNVTAVLSQARTLDAARLNELMGTLPEAHFQEIKQSFIRLFDALENTEPANEGGLSETSIRP
jgi:hypothetical protein